MWDIVAVLTNNSRGRDQGEDFCCAYNLGEKAATTNTFARNTFNETRNNSSVYKI